MNGSTTDQIAPEVRDFLDVVRGDLADLDHDELRDILDGLEGDLSELVAEQGAQALGDPHAYASELRAAAGLDPATRRTFGRRHFAVELGGLLDTAGTTAHRLAAALPVDVVPLATWLRPVWWIARAWVATQLIDVVVGSDKTWGDRHFVPDLRGFGWLLLLVAVVGSVQLGRGRVWPARDHRAPARLVLVGLNLTAIVLGVLAVNGLVLHLRDDPYQRGFESGMQRGINEAQQTRTGAKAGVYADGKWVSNVYPYDAQGHPLVGVQLFDQLGRPIDVIARSDCAYGANGRPREGVLRVFYPWTNGATQRLNVFPIPSRVQAAQTPDPSAFTRSDPPRIGQFPFVSVTQASLPGIRASRTTSGHASYQAGAATKPVALGC